jgi:hypothetical protein
VTRQTVHFQLRLEAMEDRIVQSATMPPNLPMPLTGSVFNVAERFLLVYAQSFVGGTDYAYDYAATRNILGRNWIRLA